MHRIQTNFSSLNAVLPASVSQTETIEFNFEVVNLPNGFDTENVFLSLADGSSVSVQQDYFNNSHFRAVMTIDEFRLLFGLAVPVVDGYNQSVVINGTNQVMLNGHTNYNLYTMGGSGADLIYIIYTAH